MGGGGVTFYHHSISYDNLNITYLLVSVVPLAGEGDRGEARADPPVCRSGDHLHGDPGAGPLCDRAAVRPHQGPGGTAQDQHRQHT